MIPPFLQIDPTTISTDAQFLSSVAIILGAIFVVIEMRQNDKLLEATNKEAESTSEQARLTGEQIKQNHELAVMDLIMRIYEFADSLEVQSSFMTVLSAKISSFEDFEKLPETKKLAFLQIVSLFESIGLLVERGFVKADIIDDMFATQLVWDTTKPFVLGMRERYMTEDFYFFFERLHNRLAGTNTGSITSQYRATKTDDTRTVS
jgi:hypothetical protein